MNYYNERTKKQMIEYARKHLKRVPLDLQLNDYEGLKNRCDDMGIPIATYIKRSILYPQYNIIDILGMDNIKKLDNILSDNADIDISDYLKKAVTNIIDNYS